MQTISKYRGTAGASLVEYALLLALISIVAIISVKALGKNTANTLCQAAKALYVANTRPGPLPSVFVTNCGTAASSASSVNSSSYSSYDSSSSSYSWSSDGSSSYSDSSSYNYSSSSYYSSSDSSDSNSSSSYW